MSNSPLKSRFLAWLDGDSAAQRESPIQAIEDLPPAGPAPVRPRRPGLGLRRQLWLYRAAAVITTLSIIIALGCSVVGLPLFGSPDTPTLNEVSDRYLADGMEETGAVNAVAGLILDYRAFDTFGESTVLFSATMSVIFLMRYRRPRTPGGDTFADPFADPILRWVARLLLPFLFLFGIYVVLNGHLSPGGGFSGGAILGGGLILASSLFGQRRMAARLTPRTVTSLSVVCLLTYAALKSYSFYTGANHVGWAIPKGTPGNILSAGFILPLNICVGVIVACTMYSFYDLFTEGEEDDDHVQSDADRPGDAL